MLESKHKNATLEHQRVINGITTIESWIVADSKHDKTQAFGLEYPVGTWVACMKIDNEDVWQNYVKEGIVKGFSIEGYFDEKPTKMSQESILEQIRSIIRGASPTVQLSPKVYLNSALVNSSVTSEESATICC